MQVYKLLYIAKELCQKKWNPNRSMRRRAEAAATPAPPCPGGSTAPALAHRTGETRTASGAERLPSFLSSQKLDLEANAQGPAGAR